MILALDAGLDLVLVNPSAQIPVCKIMDYGKYRYQKEKQEARQKSKARGPEIKEIHLGLKIDPHDLDFKIKRTQQFLAQGDKVKVVVKLIGREMIFRQKAYEMIDKIQHETQTKKEGSIEKMGNRFVALLTKK